MVSGGVGDKVKIMRHRLGAGPAARLLAVAIVMAGSVLLAAMGGASARTYSGAQAEAQSDPVADPYSFPNIQLCCKAKKYKKRKRRGHRYPPRPGDPYPDDDYDYPNGTVRVSCGQPERYSYSSIDEALDHVREGGRIVIRPGAACNISGLVFDRGVTIESADYAYGARAILVGASCASISTPYASSVVSFRGLDIEGCLAVQNGRLDFNEVNLASRGSGDAVRLNGGTFSSTDSTIRARGTAINAVCGLMVSLTGGGFASAARAEQTIRLDADGANLQNTLVKGGIVGVRVGMNGRYPVSFKDVTVTRGEVSEIYQVGPGNGVFDRRRRDRGLRRRAGVRVRHAGVGQRGHHRLSGPRHRRRSRRCRRLAREPDHTQQGRGDRPRVGGRWVGVVQRHSM